MYKFNTKSLAVGAAALMYAAAAPTGASAQIQFKGYAQGCFGVGCSATSLGANASSTAAAGLFTYQGATGGSTDGTLTAGQFDGVAEYNSIENSYELSIADAFKTGNLGVFTANSALQTFSDAFELVVFFLLPAAPDQMFKASISGTASTDTGGGVKVNYNPNSTNFKFSTLDGWTGDAELTLSDPTFVALGSSTSQLAGITATNVVTPEPVSMALLGTGLVGLAGMGRRRRREQSAV